MMWLALLLLFSVGFVAGCWWAGSRRPPARDGLTADPVRRAVGRALTRSRN